MPNKFKDIYVGSFWNVLSHIILQLATLLCAKYYIHYLGLGDYGIYALLSAIISPLGLLNFSAVQSNVKYISAALAKEDDSSAAAHLNAGVLISLISGIVGCIGLIAVAPTLGTVVFNIADNQQHAFIASARWTAGSWALTQLASSYSSIIVAQQRFKLFSLSTSFLSVLGLVIGLVVLLGGGDLVSVTAARFGWSVFTLAYWIKISADALPGAKLTALPERSHLKCSWNFGKWQQISSLGSVFSNQSDKYLLGAFIGAEAVGIFNIPTVIFGTIYALVTKIGDTLFPAFSKLTAAAGGAGEVYELLLGSAWVVSLVMGLGQGIALIAAPELLALLLGNHVQGEAVQVLRICAACAIFSAPSMVVTQYILGVGDTKWQALTTIVSGIVNVVGGVILIKRFGISGAAWADLAALLIGRPFIHWLIWRALLRTNLSLWIFMRALYSGPMLFCLGALAILAVREHFGLHHWSAGVGLAMAYVSLLLVSMPATLGFAVPSAVGQKLREDFLEVTKLRTLVGK